ncbi:hypothetical protein LJB77_02825, partial [Ruminococcaceae bacterium OttesenSCG-928-N02]|nr:hypothetical protein [Ruminococcaceae bacterium OttesenSCG-928-N02]
MAHVKGDWQLNEAITPEILNGYDGYEDALDALQDEVDVNAAAIMQKASKESAVYTYTMGVSGSVVTITPPADAPIALPINGIVNVTQAIPVGATWIVGSATVPAYMGEDIVEELPVNRWVSFVYDGSQLNFKAGGAALNYKVIAVAAEDDLPDNASENTIAVITTDNITNHIISAVAPSGGVSIGTIWIKTDQTNSSFGFNALRGQKAAIYVDPVAVFRWSGAEWTTLAGYIHQAGAWVALQTDFYKNGVFRADIGATPWTYNGGTVDFNASNVVCQVYAGGNMDSYIYTTNKVDLTDINTIRVDGTVDQWGGLFVLNASYTQPAPTLMGSLAATACAAVARGATVLDVSGLSGSYQIGFGLYGP